MGTSELGTLGGDEAGKPGWCWWGRCPSGCAAGCRCPCWLWGPGFGLGKLQQCWSCRPAPDRGPSALDLFLCFSLPLTTILAKRCRWAG